MLGGGGRHLNEAWTGRSLANFMGKKNIFGATVMCLEIVSYEVDPFFINFCKKTRVLVWPARGYDYKVQIIFTAIGRVLI